jgi:D-lactate dehydrogenase
MLSSLRAAVADPARFKTRAIDLHANAHDASHFLLLPQAVVVAGDAREVGSLMRAAFDQGMPLTFRSGGTSLSGQAVTDGVLVDVRRSFRDIEVLDEGARVRVQPGVTVRALNARLARFGRKFGPDPASEAACTVGGVVANNSSGMNCGISENTYRTMESLTVVLPSGTIVDTSVQDADERLRQLEPELYEGLARLSRRIRENPASAAAVRRQFSMKNTMGYGLNSLLDFDRPVDMLAHLIVGSEGTLGFVAEAVFRTIERPAHAATGLLVFPDLESANAALPAIVETGAATVELMDSLSLKVGQTLKGTPAVVGDLAVRDHTALLVEYSAGDPDRLAELQHRGAEVLTRLQLASPLNLTRDAVARAALWHLRKGLYASVAGARPQGTTALLEDIVVPVSALGRTCRELVKLFDKYSYQNSVIFGHAKDGNVHFMLTDGFASSEELDRYSAFTEDMVDLCSAKAGRSKPNTAPGASWHPTFGVSTVTSSTTSCGRSRRCSIRPACSIPVCCWTTTLRHTCATSRLPRPWPRRWTIASLVATASRYAPVRTSRSRRASGSSPSARSKRPASTAMRSWPGDWKLITTMNPFRRAPWTGCARRPAR